MVGTSGCQEQTEVTRYIMDPRRCFEDALCIPVQVDLAAVNEWLHKEEQTKYAQTYNSTYIHHVALKVRFSRPQPEA